MGVECTIFSVAASDVPAEPSLPTSTDDLLRYHSDRGEPLERLEQHPRLDLGKAWDAVHFSLGQHDGDHPLAFIESGGTDVEALCDGEM